MPDSKSSAIRHPASPSGHTGTRRVKHAKLAPVGREHEPTIAVPSAFATVEAAIEDIRLGKMVIVVDAADRENEGDLTIAAQFATPETIAFMAREGRGLICLCLTGARCDELGLRQMTDRNEAPYGTAFTVSIEAREGVSTGISAHDRARTIQVAIDRCNGRRDLVEPGHVFPLRARPGGVLERAGQTEAAVDLARLAGLNSAGVICEVMKDDGTMARVPDLIEFCGEHDLKLVTIADLIEYRRRHEKLIERKIAVRLPTAHGEFTAVLFEEILTGKQHLALVRGDVDGRQDVLVRVHSECLTGDVFGSRRCDCGEQLDAALALIAAEQCGVVLYMAQEGRGIGLLNKLKAYQLQDAGLDTVDANLALGFAADERDWGIGNQILAELGLSTIRLLTNNPKKVSGLRAYGLHVVDQVPIEVPPNDENRRYLATKRDKLGHALHHRGLKVVMDVKQPGAAGGAIPLATGPAPPRAARRPS
jgi:3,4-dihydroxy 2-butanone 4-phosphate synthase/GTP cyclohydrolase II